MNNGRENANQHSNTIITSLLDPRYSVLEKFKLNVDELSTSEIKWVSDFVLSDNYANSLIYHSIQHSHIHILKNKFFPIRVDVCLVSVTPFK